MALFCALVFTQAHILRIRSSPRTLAAPDTSEKRLIRRTSLRSLIRVALTAMFLVIPCVASSQSVEMSLKGNVTFKREREQTIFTLSEPRTRFVLIRLSNEWAENLCANGAGEHRVGAP